MDPGVILGVLIARPWLALVPAALLALAWRRRRRPVLLAAALAWCAYFPYELGMKLRWLCSGECNIRLDLMLLYPLLAVLTGWAVVAAVRARAQ